MSKQFIITIVLLAFSLFYWGCEKAMDPIQTDQTGIEYDGPATFGKLTLPAGATLNTAELFIYVNIAKNQTVNVYRINADWEEMSVTWNNFGNSFDGTTNFGSIVADGIGWRSEDITTLVEGWLAGIFPNYGLLLDQDDSYTVFYSREETLFSPYLKINYTTSSGTIIEDILPIADTYVWELTPDANHGQGHFLYAGYISNHKKLSLIRFNVDIDEELECETAFAWGGDDLATCFIELGFGNWGWTNGSLSAGNYTFDVYAGAGQCDRTKGTLVGDVTVNYNGSTATVTYNMDAGFTMSEVHLYVGNDPLPTDKKGRPTVAPGEYTIVDDDLNNSNSETYTISELSGEIYVVAHAVVCGNY